MQRAAVQQTQEFSESERNNGRMASLSSLNDRPACTGMMLLLACPCLQLQLPVRHAHPYSTDMYSRQQEEAGTPQREVLSHEYDGNGDGTFHAHSTISPFLVVVIRYANLPERRLRQGRAGHWRQHQFHDLMG